MVNTDELLENEYLNDKCCKDNDIVIVLDEGSIEVIADPDNPDNKKQILNLNVEVHGKQKIYTPSKVSLEIMRSRWGLDTKDWIGRKFSVKFVLMNVRGRELNVLRPVPI